MFAIANMAHKYVDRGDVSPYDYTAGNFVTDNTWRDLDLSHIIPKGAVLVFIYISLRTTPSTGNFSIRKKGTVSGYNQDKCYTQVAMEYFNLCMRVTPDKDGVIQYKASDTTWAAINFAVRGWLV